MTTFTLQGGTNGPVCELQPPGGTADSAPSRGTGVGGGQMDTASEWILLMESPLTC